MLYNHCQSIVGYTQNNNCQTAQYVKKGVVGLEEGMSTDMRLEILDTYLSENSECIQCMNAENCATSPSTCLPTSNVCYEVFDGEKRKIESGCATPVMETWFENGINHRQEQRQIESCEGAKCNGVGVEQGFNPSFEPCESDDSGDNRWSHVRALNAMELASNKVSTHRLNRVKVTTV